MWEPEELIAVWTLLDGDWELVGNKMGRHSCADRSTAGILEAVAGSKLLREDRAPFYPSGNAVVNSGSDLPAWHGT